MHAMSVGLGPMTATVTNLHCSLDLGLNLSMFTILMLHVRH